MPKPKNTIGDRDYAKRLYVGKGGYSRKIKTVTDSAMDRFKGPKHSESKKPYMENSYPDMEYSFDPWDPRFPPNDPLQPPEFPTNPGDPSMPPRLPWEDDPRAPHYFFGCDFLPPVFSPSHINPGEMATADLFFGPDESGVSSIEIDGPVGIVGESNPHQIFNIFKFKPAGGPYMFTVRAWDAGKIAADPHYKDMESAIPYQVTVKTAHYGMSNEVGQDFTVGVCTALGFVLRCEDPDPLEWDYDNSAATIARNSSVGVAVMGGEGPYKWRVDGTGFTLGALETVGVTNTLYADATTACGSAKIRVRDKCGQEVNAAVRCTTSGEWYDLGKSCPSPGSATSSLYQIPFIAGIFWREIDQWYIYERWELGNIGGTCAEADCPSRCTTGPYCDPDIGCSPCITYVASSYPYVSPFCLTAEGGNEHALCICASAPSYQEYRCEE